MNSMVERVRDVFSVLSESAAHRSHRHLVANPAPPPGKKAAPFCKIFQYSPPSQERLQWFRWTPEKMRLRDTSIYTKYLNGVRERVKMGTAMPCIAVCALERQTEWNLSDLELAYACSAPWQAGGSSVRFFGHPYC